MSFLTTGLLIVGRLTAKLSAMWLWSKCCLLGWRRDTSQAGVSGGLPTETSSGPNSCQGLDGGRAQDHPGDGQVGAQGLQRQRLDAAENTDNVPQPGETNPARGDPNLRGDSAHTPAEEHTGCNRAGVLLLLKLGGTRLDLNVDIQQEGNEAGGVASVENTHESVHVNTFNYEVMLRGMRPWLTNWSLW